MASLNLNKVILGGRLTADPELKTTPSGVNVCSFSLAVNRKVGKDAEQKTDFITCQSWRQTAEFISRYFKKGSSLCVVGSIQTRSWQDQNGNKRTATEVVVDEAMFVDSKNENGGTYTAPATAYTPAPAAEPKYEELATDDYLPF